MPTAAVQWDTLAAAVTRDVGNLLLGALQIAAPVVAAMLVADVGLGLLTAPPPRSTRSHSPCRSRSSSRCCWWGW
jgi:type III secretory pathway component EscT